MPLPGHGRLYPPIHLPIYPPILRPLDATTLAYVIAVVAVAALAQAVVGFGFALMAMPLLILVLDVEDALVLATLISLTNTSTLAYGNRHHIPWPTIGPMLLGAALGMPLGLALLLLAPEGVIRLLVGLSTLAMTALLLAGLRIQSRSTASELAIGGLSGALNTSTGINGPPVVLYLQGREHSPEEFRGGMGAFFFGSGLVAITSYALASIITHDAILYFVAALPAVLLASYAGHRIAARVDPAIFRRLVFALLITLALLATTTALASLL